MKVKLLTSISLFSFQVGISQTEIMLNGKVSNGNKLLKVVEVINKTSKVSTWTNDLGEFSILVKPADSLLFFAKEYHFKRYKISQENIDSKNFVVIMNPIAEELDEIVITKIDSKSLSLSKEEITEIKLNSHKSKEGLNIQGYNEVKAAPFSADFIYLGKQIYNLLKKKDNEVKNETPKIDFTQLMITIVSPEFFTNDLKLNSEEKELFIQFCDADPRSKIILENPNILTTMDFLSFKNEEFKKLKTATKN